MRKALGLTVVIVLTAWCLLWLGAHFMRSSVGRGPEHAWPLGLGVLTGVPARYPVTSMSSGAARLIALATPLGIDLAPRSPSQAPPEPRPMAFVRGQLEKWTNEELRKPVPEIAPLPSESGEYLAGRAADLTATGELLRSGEPIVWEGNIARPDAPLPNLLGHMQLHRIFVGRALDRARVGDRGAWDDLHAAWKLAESLTTRPEIISNLIALAIARRVDTAARKMPLPPAPWFTEMQAFDFRRALIAAFQADAWRVNDRVYIETTIDTSGDGLGPVAHRVVDAVMAPYTRLSASDIADRWRLTAIEVANTRNCTFDAASSAARRRAAIPWWNLPARHFVTPNIDEMWTRLLRFELEREATVRALALRSGSEPLRQSACADGHWIYADDGTSFEFSRKLPEPAVPASAMPLEFSVSAAPVTSPSTRQST